MNHLLIKHQERIYRIKLDEVCYISTSSDASHTIIITTLDQKYRFLGRLQDFEYLIGDALTRCSRSLLVNPDHVISLNPKTRTLYFDNTAQDSQKISRRYLSDFLTIWKQ